MVLFDDMSDAIRERQPLTMAVNSRPGRDGDSGSVVPDSWRRRFHAVLLAETAPDSTDATGWREWIDKQFVWAGRWC